MKYFVISDIHGSKYYLEKALKEFSNHTYDNLLILGDILYHGPRNALPKDYDTSYVMHELNKRKDKIIAIRGNCDAEVDQMVLEFKITDTYRLLNDDKILMTHGHVYGPNDHPIVKKGSCILSGHTHIPTCDEKNGCYYLNPGSISIPKGGFPNSYGVLTDTDFTVYNLETNEIIMQTKI